jgi:hypothetical protein
MAESLAYWREFGPEKSLVTRELGNIRQRLPGKNCRARQFLPAQ